MSAETGKFIDAEKARASDDSWRMLLRFLREVPALPLLLIPSIVLALIATAGLQVFAWLSGELTQCKSLPDCVIKLPVTLPWIGDSIDFRLEALALFAVSLVVIRVVGWILFEVGGQIACLGLFARMMRRVTETRTTFFDEQPSGRIINRTVRDFDQLRFMGPIRIGDALNGLVELLVIGVVIGFAHPLAGLVVVPTLLVFIYIQRNIAPMLQFCIVQRSIRFGEVLHRETDAIEGIRTFLLYVQHRTLFGRLRRAMTAFVQIHVLRAKIEAWGRFWSVIASALCSFIALSAVAYGLDNGALSATFAAVVLTAIFRLAGVFGWLTWSFGYLFESAGHARRIFEYVDLPREELKERADSPTSMQDAVVTQDSRGTPLAGDLTFDSYTMSYRIDSPEILTGLTLRIPQGAHVGLIGRTGAGKSSLVQALFRMVYVRAGDIRIGETSIFSVGIERARKSFAVMPQDPYLFAGSIRDNLDPMHIYSDELLRTTLGESQLSFALDHKISEAGVNLSLGQRQLVGLARVLLSDAPMIVMDEPTSSVDSITDSIIQRMLRSKLHGKTVITIAHRLGTLASCDLIVQLDEGRVKRSGPPSELLPTIAAELSELVEE